MTEDATRGRPAAALLLWAAVLLLHAAALWLLQASLHAPTRAVAQPSRVTLRLLPAPAPAPVAAAPEAPSPTPPVATRRRAPRPAPLEHATGPAITTPALADPAATAPSPPDAREAAAPAPLDLQRSTREAIRDVERQSRGLVQAPRAADAAPQSDTALGQEIARATRPDCQDAYSAAGLLAIPLMLYEAAGGKGTACRWR